MPLLKMLATDSGSTSGGMESVMEAAGELVTWAGELFTVIVENPVLVFYVAAGLVGIGLGIVSMLKNTAKG